MNKQAMFSTIRRDRFLKEIEKLWPLAKGALTEVRKTCNRPGCKACASGKKHPVWIYTFWEQGRQRCLYVSGRFVAPLRQAIANGRRFEKLLTRVGREMICAYRLERDRLKSRER